MKIISIAEFMTEEGANKTLEFPIDTRAGLFFKVITSTFETPAFTADNENVPVKMFQNDRAIFNVKVGVKNGTLEVNQIYQQADRGFIITLANDDWTDTPEYKAIIIDAMTLDTAVMNGGNEESVVTGLNNTQVRLRIGNTSASAVYSQRVKTLYGQEYIYPLSWTAHNAGTAQDPTYDYHYVDVPRMLTVFGK